MRANISELLQIHIIKSRRLLVESPLLTFLLVSCYVPISRSGSIIISFKLMYALEELAANSDNITNFLSNDALAVLNASTIAGESFDSTYLNTVVAAELTAACKYPNIIIHCAPQLPNVAVYIRSSKVEECNLASLTSIMNSLCYIEQLISVSLHQRCSKDQRFSQPLC